MTAADPPQVVLTECYGCADNEHEEPAHCVDCHIDLAPVDPFPFCPSCLATELADADVYARRWAMRVVAGGGAA